MRLFVGVAALSLVVLSGAQEITTLGEPGAAAYMGSIDTRTLLPAIDKTLINTLKKPENPSLDEVTFNRRTSILPQVRNNLPVGGLLPVSRTLKEAKFRGPEDPVLDPPDPCAAVGPNHVVMVVNARFGFYQKSNGAEQLAQNFSTFFGATAETDFQFDPKVVYDPVAGRFYMLILDGFTASNPPDRSNVLLAVSDDSDPNGVWHKYRINTTIDYNGTPTWLDYASLGFNKDGVMFGGNSFGFSGGAPGCTFFVIRKSSILNGGTPVVTIFKDETAEVWSPQAVENQDPTLAKSYFVNAEFPYSVSNRLQIHRIDNIAGTPTKTTTFLTVPSFDRPAGDARSTNNRFLDSLDARTINAVYRPGRIVMVHTIDVNGSTGVRWYELNVNTATNAVTLLQSGNIAQAGVDMHMGSISKNSLGDIALTFTRSSPTIAADIMMAGRKATDPLGSMGAPVLLESSAGTNYTQGGGRWGDYASTSVDPSNHISFWGGHMNIRIDNEWRTGFFKFNVTTPMQTVTIPSAIVGGANSSGTVTLEAAANGATTVNLTSSHPTILAVPASVTVPNGATSANFAITTQTVAANQSVVVTATQGENVKTDSTVVQIGTEPDLVSVNTAQTTIGGGRTVVGTITLSGPAVGSGATISLSDNGAELSVPTSLTIPAGQTTGTFNVNTNPVAQNVTRTITATKASITKTKNVLIIPYRLTGFSINVSSVIAGNNATGIVNINTYAPQAGTVVAISDNSAALNTPTSVTIPSGVGGITFPIGTTATSVEITRTVTATFNGTSITRSLTVTLPDITFMSADPKTVKGGTSIPVTIHANGLPGNNFIVNLTSSGAPLFVPPTVTFTYAQSSKVFTATTAPTASTQVKYITATRNGRTRTITFTITP